MSTTIMKQGSVYNFMWSTEFRNTVTDIRVLYNVQNGIFQYSFCLVRYFIHKLCLCYASEWLRCCGTTPAVATLVLKMCNRASATLLVNNKALQSEYNGCTILRKGVCILPHNLRNMPYNIK